MSLIWERINDSEEILKDDYGNSIAYLIKQSARNWLCKFVNAEYNNIFYISIDDMENVEEAKWQATLFIYNTCRSVAKSFYHIRDNLPKLRNLREDYEATKKSIN